MEDRALAAGLSGASNFRDLGGIATADGRRIRRGRIYRSDSLAELTPEDLDRVASLGLRTICDLRDATERRHKPNRLPAGHAIREHDVGFLPRGAKALLASLGPHSDEAGVVASLSDYYRRFPFEHASNYGRMFRALLGENALPALIHCTSGKDRTGFGIALLLMVLGVPRSAIVEDYLVSNRAPRDLRFMVPPDVPGEALRALMQVREDYLLASFGAIDAHWPDEADYFGESLRLSPEDRVRLQEILLE